MRVIKKIWWFPLVIYMIVIPSYMSDTVYSENCKKITINIQDSIQHQFISSGRILSIIQNDNEKTLGRPINDIDIDDIEKRLKEIDELESVEVYRTAEGVIHIDLDQRNPMVRIITSFGNSFYIDNQGVIIPHSRVYTPRVPVITGNISIPDNCIAEGNINMLPDNHIVKKILRIAESISGNELWSGQFEQIWITDNEDVELIPRVGNHIIKLGQPDNYESRLINLENLYKNAIGEIGWNRYSEINLMYEGQIVCKRK